MQTLGRFAGAVLICLKLPPRGHSLLRLYPSPKMEAHLLFHGGCSTSTPSRRTSTRFAAPLLKTPLPTLSLPALLSFPPRPHLCLARKSSSSSDPILRGSAAEEPEGAPEETEAFDDGEGDFDAELRDDEILDDDDDFEDDLEPEEDETYVGDGADGGGVSLSGASWSKKALALAEEASLSFGGDLKIYAFRTRGTSIQVRVEKLSNKSGSPSMNDLEAFTMSYQSLLDEAVSAGSIPDNLSLEVSSPGVERVVQIPKDLERFKHRPMYVKYIGEDEKTRSPTHESDGIFRLVSYDPDLAYCIWGVADVRANRERAGKGRPLTKKQREWRLQTSFKSLRLVRIYSDC